MKVAVAGGRDYQPTREQAVIFGRLFRLLGGTVLLHGCCPARGAPPTDGVPVRMRGVDAWVEARAAANGVPVERFPPLQLSIGWPRCAHARNMAMVRAAEAVIVFPGGNGTRGTAMWARRFDRPLYEILDWTWVGPCPVCRDPGDGEDCGCLDAEKFRRSTRAS